MYHALYKSLNYIPETLQYNLTKKRISSI